MLFNRLRLILLLFIYYIQSKSIEFDGDFCRTNKDCTDLGLNSVCWNQKCLCWKSDGILRCLFARRYRRQLEGLGVGMLGDECQSNDECRRTPMDGTKVCTVNQCQCSLGYVPIDAYRCIRDFVQPVASDTKTTESTETEEPPGYGSLCMKNEDCQHLTVQLECLRGTCVCLDGYVPLGKYLCYNIRGQGAPVVESSTFTTTLSTTTDLPKEAIDKSLDQNCITDDYCQQLVPHSHCSNGKCACMNGYISLDPETCIKSDPVLAPQDHFPEDSTTPSSHYRSLLGGQCLTNQDCQTADVQCFNNICTCPIGSFPIDEWNCLEDLDVKSTIPSSPSSYFHQHPQLDATKLSTTTVFHWWPWTTSSTTLQSPHLSQKTDRFRCLINRQCLNMDRNSHCRLGRCVCNIGYKLDITASAQRCIRHIKNKELCD